MSTHPAALAAAAAVGGLLAGGAVVYGISLGQKPETPAACVEALAASKRILTANQDVSDGLTDFFNSMEPTGYGSVVQAGDLEAISATLNTAAESITTSGYGEAADECLAAAE